MASHEDYPFPARPEIGQPITFSIRAVGLRADTEKSVLSRRDAFKRHLERAGRVQVSAVGRCRVNRDRGNWLIAWQFVVTAVEPWWDHNKPLLEPEYMI